MSISDDSADIQQYTYKAETRQLLDILVHSLYTEREIFLRELISNASDALSRLNFEMLTNHEIYEPDKELSIHVLMDKEKNQLTIKDSGIGMTRDELIENLGTIAHSGAKAFLETAKENQQNLAAIIGQFGVGFYSAFMVAKSIKVISRSYKPEAQAAFWESKGDETYEIGLSEKQDRGTEIILDLTDDAKEFVEEYRLRNIIKKHSDFVPFPIYLGDNDQQVNQQTAIWRKIPSQVKPDEYESFYKQFTLEVEKPITYTHISIDAPVQVYSLLYVPGSLDKGVLSLRKDTGIKLYARKILIQDFNKELLPEFLRFIEGVVDSEDLPLNLSRETIQSTRILSQLRKVLTGKLLDHLMYLSKNNIEVYIEFWNKFGQFIKEGVATDYEYYEKLLPLIRFRSLQFVDELISLDQYIENRKPDQDNIYYLIGDDDKTIRLSPHLELFTKNKIDVLILSDSIDPFMMLRLTEYKDCKFINITSDQLELPKSVEDGETESTDQMAENEKTLIVDLFKKALNDKVVDVRISRHMVDAPARIIYQQGTQSQDFQRVYKILNQEVEAPQLILEINPNNEIIRGLTIFSENQEQLNLYIEQIYEDALLIEGLHPDPASMIDRIQKIMSSALRRQNHE
ncbi:MAG: molecular chaperone HtpG [Anaerolineaceae bacterium]